VSALWRVQDAVARVRRLLAQDGSPRPLAAFLPGIPADASVRDLRCGAAVASTFVAGLELEREGSLTMQQEALFAQVLSMEPT
jgi:segregation and condensation protein A